MCEISAAGGTWRQPSADLCPRLTYALNPNPCRVGSRCDLLTGLESPRDAVPLPFPDAVPLPLRDAEPLPLRDAQFSSSWRNVGSPDINIRKRGLASAKVCSQPARSNHSESTTAPKPSILIHRGSLPCVRVLLSRRLGQAARHACPPAWACSGKKHTAQSRTQLASHHFPFYAATSTPQLYTLNSSLPARILSPKPQPSTLNHIPYT